MPNQDKLNNPVMIECSGKRAIGAFPSGRGCGNTFNLRGRVKLETVKTKDGVARLYVRCPFCETKYIVSYSNTKITHLQVDIKKLSPHEENNAKRDQLAKEIEAEQQRLKELYGI